MHINKKRATTGSYHYEGAWKIEQPLKIPAVKILYSLLGTRPRLPRKPN